MFVIDGAFYADPENLCFLPKSLEILVISYYDINFSNDIFNGPFLKLRELYVRLFRDFEDDEMLVLSQSLVDFLNGLFLYIDRSCLEHLLIVEKRINYQIDPFTLDITSIQYETLEFGIELR
ncbi:putative LRR containing protein [Trachipleistophora hominis]|uniref:Putative LRR containing protein n=1 Tax=Trachipleistophora hominis TaxID=72359 RepID=L7K0L1_TRAHO|nr:putative LRR containing protein [Trachipleistophora hominis]